MPRYVTKGGMIKCHAYQFLDNDNCEIAHLSKTNPDAVKIVGRSPDLRTIFVDVNDSNVASAVHQHYYLVFYDDGEVSVMSPEMFSAHYERDNPYLKGQ